MVQTPSPLLMLAYSSMVRLAAFRGLVPTQLHLLDNQTRAALHAPTSKDWIRNFDYPFGSTYNRCKSFPET